MIPPRLRGSKTWDRHVRPIRKKKRFIAGGNLVGCVGGETSVAGLGATTPVVGGGGGGELRDRFLGRSDKKKRGEQGHLASI